MTLVTHQKYNTVQTYIFSILQLFLIYNKIQIYFTKKYHKQFVFLQKKFSVNRNKNICSGWIMNILNMRNLFLPGRNFAIKFAQIYCAVTRQSLQALEDAQICCFLFPCPNCVSRWWGVGVITSGRPCYCLLSGMRDSLL